MCVCVCVCVCVCCLFWQKIFLYSAVLKTIELSLPLCRGAIGVF